VAARTIVQFFEPKKLQRESDLGDKISQFLVLLLAITTDKKTLESPLDQESLDREPSVFDLSTPNWRVRTSVL
jgi:hypothetical protein